MTLDIDMPVLWHASNTNGRNNPEYLLVELPFNINI
jgi:hypothetical protein